METDSTTPVVTPTTAPVTSPAFIEGAVIELGDEGYDVVSGVSGVAILKTVSLDGGVRFALQPRVPSPGAPLPDSWYVDHHSLRVTAKAVLAAVPPKFMDDLRGCTAKDTITGFKGIVTGMSYHLNGCVYVNVTPKMGKKDRKNNTPPALHSFPAGQVKVYGSDDADAPNPVTPKPESKKAPGGLSERSTNSPAPRF